MLTYVARRVVALAVSLAAALVGTFVLLRLLPGDPAAAALPADATADQIAAARRAAGLDVPLVQQFGHWIADLGRLHLGESMFGHVPVAPELAQRLSITVPLALLSFTFAVLVAVPLGYVLAKYSRSSLGTALSAVSQIGIAIPAFWLGILLVWAFALAAPILPPSGIPQAGWSDTPAMLQSLALPVLTITTVLSAGLTRYVRSAFVDVLDSGFLVNLQALGSSLTGAVVRHGIRAAAVPLTSVLGIHLAAVLAGTVVIESVFALPGVGTFLVTGISQHDYPVIQAVVLLTTLLVLVIGFVADLGQKLLDPRLRRAAA